MNRFLKDVRLGFRMSRKNFSQNVPLKKAKPEPEIKFDIKAKKETLNVIDAEQMQEKANTYFNFFKTVKGQKIVGGVFIVSSVGAFAYHISTHYTLRNWVKSMYQSYTNGFPTGVSQTIKKLFKEVETETGGALGGIQLFVLSTQEPQAWGEVDEGLLGYPEYMHWESTDSVPLPKMRFVAERTDTGDFKSLSGSELQSPVAKAFSESLVLSDSARKFVLCREVGRLESCPHFYMGCMASLWVLATYNLGRLINKQLGLFKRPPILRISMYNFLGLSMGLLYFISKDAFMRRMDLSVDRRAANVSPSYAAGGVEYYSKLMQRNRALRVLQPSLQGSFTLDGDFTSSLLRKKCASLTDRLEVCQRRI